MAWLTNLLDRWRHRDDDLACQMVVELMTDYLDGAMDEAQMARFERHLRNCGACVNYLEQLRATVQVLGEAPPPPPDPSTRDALIAAFRDFDRH